MQAKIIAAIIVIVVLLIWWIHYYYINKFITSYISGLWICDLEFCEAAGLDSVLLMMNAEEKKGYIVMNFPDTNLYNDSVSVEGFSGKMFPDINGVLEYDIKLSDESGAISEIFDGDIKCLLDMIHGKMIWKNEDTTLAIFCKDNVSA